MDLRQLRSFLQVASSGSFSAASSLLTQTQPALSRQVKVLEADLGVALFHRTGRGVVLTAAGRAFAEDARGLVADMEAARRRLAAFAQNLAGGAVIGLPPTVGRALTMALTRHVKAAYPLVRLQIVEGFSGTMVEWLRNGRIDLAVLYDDPGLSTVQAEPVVVEDLCVIAAPDAAPFSTEASIPFAALAEQLLILPTQTHGLRRLVEARAAAEGVTLNIGFEIDSLHSMIEAAKQGLGCTILPPSAVRAELEAGVLTAKAIGDPPLIRTLIIATAGQRGEAMRVRELSQLVRGQMLAVQSEAGWRLVRP